MPFTTLSSLTPREILGGTILGRYAHLERMTIGEVELRAGMLLPMHSHPHEQVSYVLAGRLEFTIGDETRTLEPGMTMLIPSGVVHGGKTLTACRVLDVFAPVREDYR